MEKLLTGQDLARVTLAKDVIAQLDTRRFIAMTEVYVAAHGDYANVLASSQPGDDAKTVLENVGVCEVCAIGSLFLATIERHNGVKMGELSCFGHEGARQIGLGDREAREPLLRFFSGAQLELIESAFEGSDFRDESDLDEDDIDAAVAFGSDHANDDTRLRAIMNNIIANGEFVP